MSNKLAMSTFSLGTFIGAIQVLAGGAVLRMTGDPAIAMLASFSFYVVSYFVLLYGLNSKINPQGKGK